MPRKIKPLNPEATAELQRFRAAVNSGRSVTEVFTNTALMVLWLMLGETALRQPQPPALEQ